MMSPLMMSPHRLGRWWELVFERTAKRYGCDVERAGYHDVFDRIVDGILVQCKITMSPGKDGRVIIGPFKTRLRKDGTRERRYRDDDFKVLVLNVCGVVYLIPSVMLLDPKHVGYLRRRIHPKFYEQFIENRNILFAVDDFESNTGRIFCPCPVKRQLKLF